MKTYKTSIRCKILPLALMIGCGLGAAQAVTTLSITATLGGDANDISQPMQNNNGWASMTANNWPVGNTFLTGDNAAGYTFDSLSVAVRSPENAATADPNYRINIYTISGMTATSVFTATVALPSIPAAGSYLTFLSNDGFVLNPSTTYAFTVTSAVSGANSSSMWFGHSNGDPYADGSAILVAGGGAMSYLSNASNEFDMTFNLGVTPIPEPASAGLSAIGACFLLRRRRA